MLGACTGSAAASAQNLEQYFPAGVPGYGNNPGVTVLSRSREEYVTSGIRVGGIILRPDAQQEIGYNDNVIGTTQAAGSPLVETRASLHADTDWARNSLSASVDVDNQVYTSLRNENLTNWSASMAGRYDLGRDSASLSYTHFNLNQSPSGINSYGLGTPIPFSVEDVRVSYTAPFGRFSLSPNFEATTYRFGSGIVSGNLVDQGFRNRVTLQGGVTARYELSTGRNLLVVVNDYTNNYTSTPTGQPTRDNTGVEALAGLEYSANGVFRYRILAGFENHVYRNSAYRSRNVPVAQGSVVWTPTGLTTVTATALRRIEESNDDTTGGFTFNTGQVVVDHEYLRNILLQGSGGVQYAQYEQGGGTQTIYTAGAGATWLINRNMRLTARYDFSSSSSSSVVGMVVPQIGFTTLGTGLVGVNGQFTSGRYTQNIYTLQLRVAL
ncbi:MAG: outer membrane beta-barrel protein [Janthinobacterium lividum]